MSLNEELSEMLQTDLDQALEKKTIENDDLLAILADRIRELLRTNLDGLMSMMYRLDIDEAKIADALSPHQAEDAGTILARLIILRQQQRMHTRKKYSQSDEDNWIDLD